MPQVSKRVSRPTEKAQALAELSKKTESNPKPPKSCPPGKQQNTHHDVASMPNSKQQAESEHTTDTEMSVSEPMKSSRLTGKRPRNKDLTDVSFKCNSSTKWSKKGPDIERARDNGAGDRLSTDNDSDADENPDLDTEDCSDVELGEYLKYYISIILDQQNNRTDDERLECTGVRLFSPCSRH
jgi:hypothetical protein